MLLALGDRQAISVGPEAAGENCVAVDDQMLRSDGRGDVLARALDEVGRVGGRDMLEHDFEPGEVADDARQHAFDEHRLAVEHVDVRVGHLAVDAQHHADLLHPREHG